MIIMPFSGLQRAVRTLPDQYAFFDANGTFTASTAGKYRVFVVGGGGAGGGQNGASGAGGSGYFSFAEVTLAANEQVAVTIGAGGSSGGSGNGNPGFASSFGNYLTAAGGGAGLNDGTGGDGGSGGSGAEFGVTGGTDGSDGGGVSGGTGQGVGAISPYFDLFVAYRPYVGLGGSFVSDNVTFGGGGGGGVVVGLISDVNGGRIGLDNNGKGYGAGGGGSRQGGGSGGFGAIGCVLIEGPI